MKQRHACLKKAISFDRTECRLPVVGKATVTDHYKAIMDISLAVISRCERLLLLEKSPAANRERDLILAQGLLLFSSVDEIEEFLKISGTAIFKSV